MDTPRYERLIRAVEEGDEPVAADLLWSEAQRRGDKRSMLAAQLSMVPTEAGWNHICTAVDSWFLSDEQPEIIALAQERLARWPDAFRHAPDAWLQTALKGRPLPQLELVRSVKVAEPRLLTDGARALANCYELRLITFLDLDWSHIGPEGAAALARSPHMARLQTLKLYWNHINAEGAAVLAATPLMSRLRHLFLNRNNIEDEGVIALVESPYMAGLVTLKIGANNVGSDGAHALAESPYMSGLRRLFLIDNKIGPSAKRALRTSPHLKRCKFWF